MKASERAEKRHRGGAFEESPEAEADQPSLPSSKGFLLRLTRGTDSTLASFSGRIEHVDTGRRRRFASREEFFAALTVLLREHGGKE